MKRSLVLFLSTGFLSAALLSSCQETDSPVEGSLYSLQVSKDKIMLSTAAISDSTYVWLQCGCTFTLSVEEFSGDTSAIHFEQYDASTGAHRVALKFIGDTLANVGSYSAKLALLSSGDKGTYRDTITIDFTR